MGRLAVIAIALARALGFGVDANGACEALLWFSH